jgi:hypothetical protein
MRMRSVLIARAMVAVRVHWLAARGRRHHPAGMFVVTEAEAAAIRAAFAGGGELAAAVELRRLFPGVMGEARVCARTIASWAPLPLNRLRPEKPR